MARLDGGSDGLCFFVAATAGDLRNRSIALARCGGLARDGGCLPTHVAVLSHGGWPLFHAGAFNISASVKAYYALKMIGEEVDAPHMRRARVAILQNGGAAKSNVFTRCLLALYGQIPWRGVPVMPIEIMLLPRWFPFHLNKISYWARTVLVPLLVLLAMRCRARHSRSLHRSPCHLPGPSLGAE